MNTVKRTVKAGELWKYCDGKASVTILKMDHPNRQQRVMIVPTPRFASEEFYNAWCYQPYVRDHQLRVSNDIFNPVYVAIPRIMINQGVIKGHKYFTPVNMPDAIDNNITRREYVSRERSISTFTLIMIFTLNSFRDKYHPWISRKVMNLVGSRYLSHPREEEQSFVLMMPPSYAATACNTLQDIGFKVSDKVTVDAGDQVVLKKLYFWADVGQFAVISYLWLIIGVMIINEGRRFIAAFHDYQIHLFMIAGRDPNELGFTVTEEDLKRVEAAYAKPDESK